MNWKTTTFGSLFAAATAISVNPQMVYDVFPVEMNGNLAWDIVRASKILVFVFGVVMAVVAKDKTTPPSP